MYSFQNGLCALGGLELFFKKKETIKLWEKFKAFLCEYDIS